jgi:hypothetical protein
MEYIERDSENREQKSATSALLNNICSLFAAAYPVIPVTDIFSLFTMVNLIPIGLFLDEAWFC